MSPVRGNQDLQRAVLQKGHLWETNQTFLSCKSTFRVFPNTANSPSLRLLSYHFAEPELPAKGTWTIRREEKQPNQHKWCSRILNVALRRRTTEFEQEHESYNVLDIEVWSFWEHLNELPTLLVHILVLVIMMVPIHHPVFHFPTDGKIKSPIVSEWLTFRPNFADCNHHVRSFAHCIRKVRRHNRVTYLFPYSHLHQVVPYSLNIPAPREVFTLLGANTSTSLCSCIQGANHPVLRFLCSTVIDPDST